MSLKETLSCIQKTQLTICSPILWKPPVRIGLLELFVAAERVDLGTLSAGLSWAPDS